MDKQTEALKLALEALEESLGYVEEEAENAQRLYGQYPTRQARIQGLKDDARKHMNAITAIREALAEQPAQQWNAGVPPLYPEPEPGVSFKVAYEQPAQQQEPVITKNEKGLTLHVEWDDLPAGTKLYTSPQPRKPWVGLTNEEANKIYKDGSTFGEMMRMVEVKLKEKNA